MAGFHLERFVEAQLLTYEHALAELRRGRKQSHWMWFVFPQIAGLGSSAMARHYAIGSAGEAWAYLGHPLLGARLFECTGTMLAHRALAADAILGPVDAVKLRSSMTLFEAVAEDKAPFAAVLDAFYEGRRDARTLALLRSSPG